MGMFLPAAATAAGTAGTAAAGTTAAAMASYAALGASVLGAGASVMQGQAGAEAAKAQAMDERIQARDRELERRRQLLRVLATQNVKSAAGGVAAYEGSPANLMRSDMDTAGLDHLTDRASTNARLAALRARGASASRSGLINAGASLLNGYSDYKARGV